MVHFTDGHVAIVKNSLLNDEHLNIQSYGRGCYSYKKVMPFSLLDGHGAQYMVSAPAYPSSVHGWCSYKPKLCTWSVPLLTETLYVVSAKLDLRSENAGTLPRYGVGNQQWHSTKTYISPTFHILQ